MKTILVTGATGGIGSRVCRRLAKKGDEVILVSRSMNKLSAFAAELKGEHTGTVSTYVADFASHESTASFLESLTKNVMRLDGLVLIYPSIPKSADIIPSAPVWRDVFETCFIQPLACIKSAIRIMKKEAKIVIVSGIANTQVFPQLPMSNAIRSAWLAEAKTLAFNYGKTGIHINTVSLGGTLTEKFIERTEHLQKKFGRCNL